MSVVLRTISVYDAYILLALKQSY